MTIEMRICWTCKLKLYCMMSAVFLCVCVCVCVSNQAVVLKVVLESLTLKCVCVRARA